MVRLLLWQKALIRRNELLRGPHRWRKRISWLAGIAAGALFMSFVFTISLAMFESLLAFDPAAIRGLIAGGFTVLTTFALFWGIGTALSDLYLSSDLELLLTAPVPRRDIFWLKLLGAMWQSAGPTLIPTAILVAYGVAAAARPDYYLGAVLALLLMLTILAAVSLALVMLLMRLMPARRAREIYSLIYVIFFAGIWLGWMALSRDGGAQSMRFSPQLVSTSSRLALPPASWAGDMMLAWARGDWAQVAYSGIVLVLLAAAVTALAGWLFDRSFHRDWAAMHEVAPRSRLGRGAAGRTASSMSLGARAAAWLPSPARELAAKDWTIMPRDLRQLSRLVMPLVVSLFYVYQFGFAAPLRRELPGMGFWLMLMILPIVPLFFALAFGTPSIGKEGANFELLRVVPISVASLLWGKVWMAAIPTAVIGMLVTLVVALLLNLAGLELLILLGVALVLSVVMSVISVALGAMTPNFSAVDYRRAAGPLASWGTMLGSMIVWAAALATAAAMAIHLPSNARLVTDLSGALGGGTLADLLLRSPLPLLVALALDALVAAGLGLLWRFSVYQLSKWQPGE